MIIKIYGSFQQTLLTWYLTMIKRTDCVIWGSDSIWTAQLSYAVVNKYNEVVHNI